MNRQKKYTINGAFFAGISNAILNAITQFHEINKNPELKFDWNRILIASGKGVVIGGVGGAIIGAIENSERDQEKPVNTDKFLYSVVDNLKLNKEDRRYIKLQEKSDLLIELLKNHFCKKISGEPIKLGSTVKGTALKEKFDIDIAIAFKSNSFQSTAVMFHEVFEFIDSLNGRYSIVEVRDQKKSIGVIFMILQQEHKIDIVPYKRSNSHRNNKAGYLYVNNSNFLMDYSTYTKTDIHALNSIKLTEDQKRVIILLKHWKTKNNLPLSSHLLENLVVDAYKYNKYKIPRDITQKTMMVFKHIADNLDVALIRSIENTNNILTNISNQSKNIIIDACIKAIEEYDYHPNSLIETFE